MNRSFSKIRHIQLSNILLEERIKKEKGLLSEDVQSSPEVMDPFANINISSLVSSAELPPQLSDLKRLEIASQSTINSIEMAAKDEQDPPKTKSLKSEIEKFICNKSNNQLVQWLNSAIQARAKRRADRKAKRRGTTTDSSNQIQEQGATVLNPGGEGPLKVILFGVGWVIIMILVLLLWRRKQRRGGCPGMNG